MKRNLLLNVALTGMMAAVVCAASWIRIDLPSPVGNTAIHLGNVVCILAGLLLGPIPGGLAAGIGSCLFDLFHPAYVASAPFTLCFKFCIGFFAGLLAYSGHHHGEHTGRNITGAVLGSTAYILLYLTRSYLTAIYVSLMQPGPAFSMLVPKAVTSITNAVIAVVCAVPLSAAIRTALEKAGLSLPDAGE